MAEHKEKQRVISLVAKNINVMTALMFQMNGIVNIYAIYRKQLNQNILLYYAIIRNRLLIKLKEEKLRRLRRKKKSVWVKPGRTDMWWENMIMGVSSPECWQKNFRMTREQFNELCDELRPHISPNPNSPNYRALPLEKKVAIALYYLKDTGSTWMTANTFGIHQCTVSKVVVEFSSAVVKNMTPKLITLPKTVEDMHKKVSEFELRFGMVQAFGCIDGTHIPIKTHKITSATNSTFP